MTTHHDDRHPPVTSEVEDLRQVLGDCTRGILDAIPQLAKPEARLEAAQLMGTYAKNHGYQWSSLQTVLKNYSVLLAQLPDRAGTVDALPLGTGMTFSRSWPS